MSKPIRLIVVDDSALMRQVLTEIFNSDPEIEVVDTAIDPLDAREKIKRHNPDVISLDIEMPKMDGLTFLEKIMRLRPMPVVMVSTLTQKGAEATLRALELGAVDFFAKPELDQSASLDAAKEELTSKIKAAARANVRARESRASTDPNPGTIAPIGKPFSSNLIALGSSTGGVEALTEIITALPPDIPPTLVTQHMPDKFLDSFASRLDGISTVSVSIARDGAKLEKGNVYIAGRDRNLHVVRSSLGYTAKFAGDHKTDGHCPSVTEMFMSVAEAAGPEAIGAILTGMGKDGARGLLAMRQAGARTFGQNQATCVVYGMPKAAAEIGAVEKEVPISSMVRTILDAATAPAAKQAVG